MKQKDSAHQFEPYSGFITIDITSIGGNQNFSELCYMLHNEIKNNPNVAIVDARSFGDIPAFDGEDFHRILIDRSTLDDFFKLEEIMKLLKNKMHFTYKMTA